MTVQQALKYQNRTEGATLLLLTARSSRRVGCLDYNQPTIPLEIDPLPIVQEAVLTPACVDDC